MMPIMNATADPLEIQKFSELAHRWWDPTSEFRPLHDINPLRLEWINARAPLAGKHVIDIGCGGGILSESMARKGATVTGIDLSKRHCAWPTCTASNRACRCATS
jgi:2-polyprenyl-6-hydroxyphenyl methylase/3-demethylubiquinone-9 3-methyltransferase